MNKKLEALQKEIKQAEDSRKQFIAKFENRLQTVNSDIEACEAAIKQSVTDEDFNKFESESDRMASLKKRKAYFEECLHNAETAEVGDAKKMENAILQVVKETTLGYRKELVQHTEAMLKISNEIEEMRKEANQLLLSIRKWSDKPVGLLSLDDSANASRWGHRASEDGYYVVTVEEHPEWSKLK